MREKAAPVTDDIRNRMTDACHSKFMHSGQPQNSKRMLMGDCMAEAMKATSQPADSTAPAE